MNNLEFYKDEIYEIQKDLFDKGLCISDSIGVSICNVYEKQIGLRALMPTVLDWLLEEHKEPIKLTKFEYDLLMSYINKGYFFRNYSELKEMRNKGYFKGIKDMSVSMDYILNNCIIVSDDYEGFEDCK